MRTTKFLPRAQEPQLTLGPGKEKEFGYLKKLKNKKRMKKAQGNPHGHIQAECCWQALFGALQNVFPRPPRKPCTHVPFPADFFPLLSFYHFSNSFSPLKASPPPRLCCCLLLQLSFRDAHVAEFQAGGHRAHPPRHQAPPTPAEDVRVAKQHHEAAPRTHEDGVGQEGMSTGAP